MKIIEQLEEDKFVIQMDDYDLQKQDSIKVEHDYVEFSSNYGITTESPLTVDGKFARCSNWIKCLTTIQIPIREMIKVVLPYLNSHPYCQPVHLIRDGKPNYCWGKDVIFYTAKDNEEMVAIRLEGEEEYTHITRQIYDALTKEEL